MVRPRVLVDVDGVLADFMTPACETMNKIMGTNVKPEDMKSWYLFDAFDFEVPKKVRDACYDEWKKPGWCAALKPLPGAQEGLGRLRDVAEVVIVTSPMDGPTWAYERSHWLRRHFGFERYQINHTDGKHNVAGDMIIDDKTDHCVNWKACNPTGTAVRWHAVTNRFTPYHGITTDSWDTVVEIAQTYSHTGDRLWKHLAI